MALRTFGNACSNRSSLSPGPTLTRMQRLSGATPGMRMKTPWSISPSTMARVGAVAVAIDGNEIGSGGQR